jgi:hypothetical protein
VGAGEAVDVGVGLLLLALGGAIATRQAFRRTGALMALSGAAWLAGDVAGPLVDLQRGPLVHLLLSYPRGRLPGTLARTTVALAYLDGAVEPVGALDGLTAALAVLVVIAAVDGWARAGGLERRARMTSLAAAALVGGALVGAAVARRIGTADPCVAACQTTKVSTRRRFKRQ